MKQVQRISTIKQTSTILLGVVLAFVLGVSQIDNFNQEVVKPTVEKNESGDDQDTTQEVVIVQAVNAITSTVQLHLSHVLYFISETVLSDSPKIVTGYFEKPYFATYLTIVFRQIISPNAP